jgi:branched-chain amino acid transport system ATP-binding protein
MSDDLEVLDAGISFGALVAVADVTLSFPAGSMTGIIGPNGAGKTTLLSMLSGELVPTRGRIVFGGHELGRLAMHRVCRLGVCRTHQIPRPFGEMSVLENVEVASLFGGRAKVDPETVLRDCALEHLAAAPADTLRPSELRRLELAKALATDPQVLLVDEIAAGMPSEELPALADQLRRINEAGVTLVVVEHVMELLLRLVPRLVALDQGRVVADGPTSEVLRDERVLSAYFGEEVTGVR